MTKTVRVETDSIPLKRRKLNERKSNAIHGWTYQLKILMLAYIRAVANGYENFKLNTENEDEFGKFDDAILEIVQIDKTFIRSVQIKHVKGESTRIQSEDLRIRPKKGEQSKLGAKYVLPTYFESFLKSKVDIDMLILFTNLSFGVAVPNELFEEIIEPDRIFDISIPDNKNNADTSLPWDHNNRDENKIPKKYKLDYVKLVNSGILYTQFKDLVTKYKTDENSIKNFCEKFIFATGQPSDIEMDLVLTNEIPKISKLPMDGLVYAEYMNTFLGWLNNKYENGEPLTYEDMKIIIPLIKFKVEKLARNLNYYEIMKDLKYELEDSTINKVRDYFRGDYPNQFLPIWTKFPILTLAKILQCCLEVNGEFTTIEVTNETDIKKVDLIKFFKFCVIIFHADVGVDWKIRTCKKLKNNKRKVVVLNNFDNYFDPEDNCCFKNLQSSSKPKILDREVGFDGDDGPNLPIHKFGSIKFFDQLGDTDWLSSLITGNLRLPKKIFLSLEKNYIERKLIFQPTDSVYTINYDEEYSEQPTFSEHSMADHGQRLIILIAEAGNGKTTLLSSINHKNRNSISKSWNGIIKLTDHVNVFEKYKTNEDVVEFFSTKILKYDFFNTELLKHQIEEIGTMVIMFDGFDELPQKSKDAVLNIIENLLKTNVKQIWITSRPIAVKILKKRFSQPTIELTKFTREDVIKCFSNYWSEQGITYEMKKLIQLIDILRNNCKMDLYVPLYTKMAAEYFIPTDCNTDLKELDYKIPLYDHFIKNKYNQLLRCKTGRSIKGHIANKGNDELLIENYDDFHKTLALQMLCPEYGIKHNLKRNKIDTINSIGIATVNIDDNKIIHFDHRTFAEYFVGKYVFEELTDEREVDGKILDLLLIFRERETEFKEVLNFLDQFLDNSLILPNTIQLTDPTNIKNFKVLLDKVFSTDVYHFIHSVFICICLDNVHDMEYKLDQFSYLDNLRELNSVHLFEKYLNELEKQLTNEQLNEFIILYMVEKSSFDGFGFDGKCHDFFIAKCSNINRFVSEYLIDFDSCINQENAFIKFCHNILESRSIDPLIFSIYSFAQSIKRKFSEETINTTLSHLNEASIDNRFDFDERGKYLRVIKFHNPDETFLFYKNLIKAFRNQKEAFMNNLKVPATVLSFDEFEIILTENVEILTENLKMIIKSFGTFFISNQYFEYVCQSNNHHFKYNREVERYIKYFQKLIQYKNEELAAICDFIGTETNSNDIQEFCNDVYRKGIGIFIYTIDQPELVIECFYKQPIMMVFCYVLFLKIINGPKYSKRLPLVIAKVFLDISEIHPLLIQRNLKKLLRTALKLDSVELLKNIVTALDIEFNNKVHNNFQLKTILNLSDAMINSTKEMCKDFFLNFVNNLKMKIEASNI